MGIMVMLLEEKKKSEVNAFCEYFKLHQVVLFVFGVVWMVGFCARSINDSGSLKLQFLNLSYFQASIWVF